MAVTRHFKNLAEAVSWRKKHPNVVVTAATVTSTAPAPTYTKRQYVVRLCHWGILNKASIHYAEVRPMPHTKAHVLPHLPLTTDCSGWATICYQYAGAGDPNGNGYNGTGYTGTLLKHMRHINIASVQPGDLVVYGCNSNPTGHHVAVIIAVGSHTPTTIQTCSHGSEAGPLEITVAAESKYQPDGLAGVVYLSSIAP
jgi:cell wall-associated NlpC family hydrolase